MLLNKFSKITKILITQQQSLQKKMLSSSPQQIVTLLQMTLISSTHQIQSAEQNLKQLHEDNQFLSHLMAISKQSQIPFNTRKSAILYSLTYCKYQQQKLIKNNDLLLQTTKYLFSQLAYPQIQTKLKRYLTNTITYLLSLDKNGRIKGILYQQCLTICKKLHQNVQNNKQIDIGMAVYVGIGFQTVLIISLHSTKELQEFIRNSIKGFVQIAIKLFQIAMQIHLKGNRQQNIDILQIMKLYSSSLKLYTKKIPYLRTQSTKLLFFPQLCTLISSLWKYSLPQNTIQTPLIYYSRKFDSNIIQLYHSIKADYMQSLSLIMRAVYKEVRVQSQFYWKKHHILKEEEGLVGILVQGLADLGRVCANYQIRSPGLIKLIQQIMNCLICITKSTFYSKILITIKKPLIQNCLLKILQFSPQDYQKYEYDPQQLINQIYQIIDMDPTQFINNRKKQYQIVDQVQDIQDYTTLRTVGSTLLWNYCKYVQGVLGELLGYIERELIYDDDNDSNSNSNNSNMVVVGNQYGSNQIEEGVYQGKEVIDSRKTKQFSKPVLLLVLGILRDLITNKNQHKRKQIIQYLLSQLQQHQKPHQIELIDIQTSQQMQKSNSLTLLLTSITLYRLLNSDKQYQIEILPVLYPILYKFINDKQFDDIGIKNVMYDLITMIVLRDQQGGYIVQFLNMCIQNLSKGMNQNSRKILQVIFNIFKFKDQILQSKIETVHNIISVLCQLIQRDMQTQILQDKQTIIKSWNILSDICSNSVFCGPLFQYLEEILVRLCSSCCHDNGNESENQIYKEFWDNWIGCFYFLIRFGGVARVSMENASGIIQVLSKVFYSCYALKFDQIYQTLQLFTKHGSKFIKQNPQILSKILQISLSSMLTKQYKKTKRSQFDNIQGTLILQCTIIQYYDQIQQANYKKIIQKTIQKIQTGVQSYIFIGKVFLFSLLALIGLMLDFRVNMFTDQDCQVIIERIIKYKSCLIDPYAYKIIIIVLCDIFKKRFQKIQILQIIVDIMKIHKQKDTTEFNQNCEDFSRQYQNSLRFIKNTITESNQLTIFKQMIHLYKENHKMELENMLKLLPEIKLQFLRTVMGTARVNNQTRPIFKIKKPN